MNVPRKSSSIRRCLDRSPPVELVDKLLYHTHVDLRLNVDRENQQDVLPFIDFARARGWFERPFPAVLQPARLSSYSELSSFMRYSELSLDEYDEIRAIVRAEMKGEALVEESETPDGFPLPEDPRFALLSLMIRSLWALTADIIDAGYKLLNLIARWEAYRLRREDNCLHFGCCVLQTGVKRNHVT